MKNVFSKLLFYFLTLGGLLSFAQVQNPTLAPAERVFKNSELTNLVATLNVDLAKEKISVLIYEDNCHTIIPTADLLSCLSMPSLIDSFEVKLTSVRTEYCGSTIYEGSEDKMPVDGAKIVVRIQDNSSRLCEDIRPALIETEVNETYYARLNPGLVHNKYLIYSKPFKK